MTIIISPPRGDTGISGGKGDTGVVGASGIAGVGINWKGEYDLGTTYLESDGVQYLGSSYVSKSGSNVANLPSDPAWWDLWVSMGDTGVYGDTGTTGDKGDTGAGGAAGATGVGGAKGDTGTGGNKGDTGIVGDKGDTGASVTGDTGVSGAKGDTGTQGIIGIFGNTGITGDTGVGTKGDTGTTGGKGDTGTGGAKGDTGTSVKGDTGATSAKGDTGAAGSGKLARRLYVGANGDYSTIKAAVDWFNASASSCTEILLDGGAHAVTDTIVINNPVYGLQIRGLGSGVSFINAATGLTGKPMFEVKTNCDFNKVTMSGSTLASYGTVSGEDAIKFSTNTGVYSEIKDIFFTNFYNTINDTIGTDIFLFDFQIANSVVGVLQNYSGSSATSLLDVETGNFVSCPTGIYLEKATKADFLLSSLLFYHNLSSDIAIKYASGSSKYALNNTGGLQSITNCFYNSTGTFFSGFDFTTSLDKDIEIMSNIGEEDKSPHAKINVAANVSTTTVTAAGTYYKVAFTNGSTYANKITLADNKMTYMSSHIRDGKTWISGNVSASVNNRTVKACIRKNVFASTVTGNGTTVTVTTSNEHKLASGNTVQMLSWTGGTGVWNGVYVVSVSGSNTFTYLSSGNGTATGGTAGAILSPMTIRAVNAGVVYPFSINAYLDDMQQNDYYEIYVTSSSNSDVITVTDVNWLLDTR